MIKQLRHMLFGLNKEEREKLLEEERRRMEEEEQRKKISAKVSDLEKELKDEREAFKEMYVRALKYKIDKGYWAIDLEGGEWKEWIHKLPEGFPYICWDNEQLQNIRKKSEEILEIRKQLGWASKDEAVHQEFSEEEKMYKEVYEKQRQLCLEKYGKDQFGFLEIGQLMYHEFFDNMMKDDTWKEVSQKMKEFYDAVKNFRDGNRGEVSDLVEFIKEPPAIWLSLDEKYKYYTQEDDENWDNILEYASEQYKGRHYFCNKERSALKYKPLILNQFKEGNNKRFRDRHASFEHFFVPVYQEGLLWPYWADRQDQAYKAYEETPKFEDVFYYFPYNIHKGNNTDYRKYCQGRLFLGSLFYKYGRYADAVYYGFAYEDLVKEAVEAAKKLKPQYDNERKGVMLGIEGENLVRHELDKFDDMAINLYNVSLEYKGVPIETDCIIISPNGIFSIEVKNLGSEGQYELEVTSDGQWRKVIRERNIDEPINDAYLQAMNHVNGTRRLIKEKIQEKADSILRDREIFIQPIIVIANNQVSISNSSDQAILRPSNVYNYIFNTYKGGSTFSRQEMEEIRDIILESKLESKKYPIPDYHRFVNAIKNVVSIDTYTNNLYYFLEKQIEQIVREGKPECKLEDVEQGFGEIWYSILYRLKE